MTISLFSSIILISSITYLYAIKRKKQMLIYILKPATMLIIILFALTSTPSTYAWWIIIGLLFSLLGDIFLMVPKDRFLQGLASFLTAHVCYIIAFLQIQLQKELNVLVSVSLVAIALIYFIRLVKGKRFTGGSPLKFAVFTYILLITSMVWVSILTENLFIILAAFLFYFSDATLAWDRFIKPLKYRNYLVMSTYFLAQYLFSLSIHKVVL
ncbi:lysoplasmalogenase [Fictibacillus sp. BK138]|uniref:lysoplasmalogenase n=1 Tax=Fictibacillus sp. BK138 TaxID=2512121 RepID=UPI00102A1339|nr:lysoplasmalogenase [Fictibacillus sp. BK138]RZT21640.1 putative membrane protein YhhN [Fictibacillus sp. BK138]